MKTEEEKYQLIDQFLNGELPQNHEFLYQLANDESLKEEVNIQRLLKDAIVDYQLLNVKAELNSFHKEKVSGAKNKRWIAGSLFGLISVGALLYFFSTNPIVKENIEANESIPNEVKPKPKVDISLVPTKADVGLSKSTIKSIPKIAKVGKSLDAVKYEESVIQSDVKTKSELNTEMISTPVMKPGNEVRLQEKQISAIKKSETELLEMPKSVEKETLTEPESKPKHELKNYVFEPNNETWEAPIDSEKSGKISIFDRSGKMMYRREFTKMEKLVWEGNSSDGGTLPPSVYVFLIEYSDGTTNQGTITISY
ncbi:MAG: gliding motility-associated C-terminal domain-containing protein [Opitutaceae bacterium]|nr:gliding motility-associated C-terminal domain-containing protein [Cytophagales bacterium]